jgi:23S rRNA pseudouridine2605 synthase
MNANDANDDLPLDRADPTLPASTDASDAPPAAKKRARKPSAKALAAADGAQVGPAADRDEPAAAPAEAAPSLLADVPAAEDAPAVKSPRRRKPVVKALEGDGDAAPAAQASGTVATTDTSQAPAASPQQALDLVAPVAAPAAGPNGADGAVTTAASSEGSVGAAQEGGPAQDGAPTEGEGPRRSRNRRRGRGRGERAEGQGGEGGEGQANASADDAEGEGAANDAPPVPFEPAGPPADVVEVFAEVLSGAFDAEVEPVEAEETEQSTKRVLRPEPEAPKLHKVLAQAGIGSRRDMEELILAGKVQVNGEAAHVGMRISYGDQIKVAGKPIKVRIQPLPPRILAYHKPAGEVVTFNDPEGRPTVFRRLPKLHQGKWQSVGRLDINTEGLLLFTSSGELANQLMHPRFGVEREYAVRVLGSLDDLQREKLLEGVEIEGQTASFKSIEDGGGDGANRWYRVVITEGRNREVRKLFDKVGLAVSRLIRIRYGTVVLPRGLKRGVWVELGDNDVRTIRRLAGGDVRRDGPNHDGPRQGQGAPRERDNGKGPRGRGGKGKGGQPQGMQGQGPRPNGPPRREERGPRPDARPPEIDGEPREDFGPIPNPLEQTFDRRFARGPRRADQGFGGAPVVDDDFAPGGTIPNPLEQTFDRRFVKGSKRISAGFGRPDQNQGQGPHGPQGGKKGGPKQPDPMQTSVGYIGADAYFTKVGAKRGRSGPSKGYGGGGGGSGGGGGKPGGGRGRR